MLGTPGGGFSAPVFYRVSFVPSAIAIADFNHDGKLDLAVSNDGSSGSPGNTVSLLLGKGDGTFKAKHDYKVGFQPFDLTAADFNHDGNIDLATANFADGTASVLIGKGDGTFKTSATYAVSAPLSPIGITAIKFSDQDHIGLAVSGNNGTFILVAKGDGTFRSGGSSAPSGLKVATGDFNRDKKADLVVVTGHGVAVLHGEGHGIFQAAHDSVTGQSPNEAPDDAAVGDFNEDGKPDLAVANADGANVGILLGKGNGLFRTG
jgi:hypothetical protein